MANAAKGAINPVDLDATLDDIDDLPGFVSFPTGAYVVTLAKGFESKKIGEHPALEMAMTLKEIMELPEGNLDAGETMPKPGDIATQVFMMDNEYGAGNFKEMAKPIKEMLGGNPSIRAIMEASKGVDMMIVVKRRPGKGEQEGKNFMSITKIALI